MAPLVSDQRADDGELVHLGGDGRQHLADLDAGCLGLDRFEVAAGRGAGLEVPEIHVTGPAAHPEDDEALVGLFELFLGGAKSLEEFRARILAKVESAKPGDWILGGWSLSAAMNSPTRAPTTASVIETFMPPKIAGKACGRRTSQKSWAELAPAARAT